MAISTDNPPSARGGTADGNSDAADSSDGNGNARLYTKNDLHCYNLLNHPIWVFDSINKEMWWANEAALEFWNATSLDELLNRNYKDDMSDTMKKKNNDNIERLKRSEQWEDVVSCLDNAAIIHCLCCVMLPKQEEMRLTSFALSSLLRASFLWYPLVDTISAGQTQNCIN